MTATTPSAKERPEWRSHLDAAAVALCTLVLAWLSESAAPALSIALYLISFAAGLRHTLPATAGSVARGSIDVDFLMILVALGAWALGHPAEGALLLVLFCASRAMESYAGHRTRTAIGELMRELPTMAHVRRAEGDVDLPVEAVVPGDRLILRPGERLPVDGVVAVGSSTLDLSAINGESAPRPAAPGTDLPSGAVNGGGLLEIEVVRPASESAYQKIIRLVEEAPARRSPAQDLSDRVGRIYTAVILAGTAVAFLVWWLVLRLPVDVAAYRAMALLVAGSPCALVLSIPSAVLAAIASGARRGVLFNGGRGLLAIAGVRHVAFDKTGTLTTGQPRIWAATGRDAFDLERLAVALALARASTHPAARAVAAFIAARHPDLQPDRSLKDIAETPGHGMSAHWAGHAVALGRDPHPAPSCWADAGARVAFTVDGQPSILFPLEEQVRADARETIAVLGRRNITTELLSGDLAGAVQRVARHVGIAHAQGNLRPEAKWARIRDMAGQGGIAMVGDGINDAPALSAATVGVAMGMGASAATLAQADIVLARGRLSGLVEAMELGQRARAIVRQNLAISIGAATVLVAFALAGSLPLIVGVFGHEGGTVLVVLNSLRLLTLSSPPVPEPARALGEAAA